VADPFVGEIRLFAGNFAPTGWALCNGQILSIAQNTALFSLLGTTYGGDGRTTFALPNFIDKVPMHWGQGPGLSLHDIGESGGSADVTLLISELPAHTHTMGTSSASAITGIASDGAALGTTATNLYGGPQNRAPIAAPAGGGAAHENRQPYLGLTFIIALQGVFPPRT
jgi:microcystin-dependent protein